MKKTIVCVLLCFIISMILIGCGATKENVVGGWKGSYEYEGNTFDITLTISSNNNYEKVRLKNGTLDIEIGTWEIENGKLYLCENGKSSRSEYSLSSGTLKNGDSIRLKKAE